MNRLLDAVRGDVGLEHGIALPVWDALVRGEAEDLSVLAQKAVRRLGALPAARGPRPDPGPRRRRQAGRRRASAASTPAAASASAW